VGIKQKQVLERNGIAAERGIEEAEVEHALQATSNRVMAITECRG